jgi:glycosyltransferase involved in cell wall biosynthesis
MNRTMKRPIRVLHLIKTLGLGGAETNLLSLADAFPADRIETHVAYSQGGEIKPRFDAAGVRLFQFATGSHRVKSVQTIPIVLRLARYIRKHRIDIVHTHNFNGHIWGLLAAKLAGARLVEHVHDFRYTSRVELARRHGSRDQYRFIKYFKRASDRVVVLTDDNVRYVVDEGFVDASRVVKIPNGIPLDRPLTERNGRAALGVGDDRIVVLTGARMDPTKNIDLILRVAADVAHAAPNVLFLVAGSGSHLDEYRARCTSSGLDDHVRFIGFHQDMDGLLSCADIFLLPSFLELHSIAILEALRARVPVVVSSGVGCNDEFIEHGVNGFLCDPFIDQPWIEVLQRLAAEPALRRAIGAAGRETCERRFDIGETAARFSQIYTALATP